MFSVSCLFDFQVHTSVGYRNLEVRGIIQTGDHQLRDDKHKLHGNCRVFLLRQEILADVLPPCHPFSHFQALGRPCHTPRFQSGVLTSGSKDKCRNARNRQGCQGKCPFLIPLSQISYRDFVLLGFLSAGPGFCCQLEQCLR